MATPLYQKIYHKYQLHPAHHMTHIDNLDSLIQDGINSYNRMKGKPYTKISNDDVQAGRANKNISITNKPLHDYVPLYFGFKTPMVACNQDKNEDLIFIRFSLNILSLPGVVFTDGNARSDSTKFFLFENIDSLKSLNISAIHTVKYANDLEKKRQKQSEILIPDKLDFHQSLDIFVFSETAKNRVLAILLQHGIRKNVTIQKGWYFLKS